VCQRFKIGGKSCLSFRRKGGLEATDQGESHD
jgi:hypothetical protein